MKWYIAARFGLVEEVKAIQRKLKEKGHEVIGDWTYHRPIKPYNENVALARDYAIDDVESIRNADVFCLISDEAGTGMYVELGVAIASQLERGKPNVYVVGEQNARSMFYFHPIVKRGKTINEIIAEIEQRDE